ncbi:hypothetical protein ASC77_22220 [Nocardioides sp. Root1257]|uniref:HK97 family phage prohead protease n=1 Tax=unclassified Nocardioides TaxID=2615069 RepID=UPI0006FD5927|nr:MULTISPECIES: HK97 family phage prohead protease [unclassified Nocardioides]KQW43013.1 hypothetical protein ASC77_22220 [Nocardioides sp. Root1257]KRC41881.1 hypothetical protein ASE24_22010 [Nocardioides sp. Root224]
MTHLLSIPTTVPTRVELRRASPGFYVGLVVPYGEVSRMTEYPQGERFVYGAFATDAASDRVYPVVLDHDPSIVIGSVVYLVEERAGLVAGLRFDEATEAGRVVARAGVRESLPLSVGFRATETATGFDGARVVVRATLDHVAVVGLGAYGSARTFPTEVATRRAVRQALTSVRWHGLT